MVSKLKPTFVTDEFIGAVADSLATGNAITLTTAVASSTTYTDAQLSGLNYAGSQSATKNLTTNLNSAVVKADTNTIVIDVDLVNQNLNADFQISTVLINATYKGANILVGVVRFATPELFPAYDNISVYELEMKLYVSVSRIGEATINVSSAGMATAQSVQDLRTYVDGDFNADIARKTNDNLFTGTNTFNKKIIAPAGVQGNADSATKLQNARNINGVAFDGTADILIDPTTRIINSQTNLFNLTNGFYYNAGSTNTNAPADATAYYTVEVIQTSSNGYMVLVDSDNKAYWNTKSANAWQQWRKISDDAKAVHNSGDEVIFGKKTFSNGIIASLTGNADTASKLQTARAIGGVPFDGGSNIDLPGVNKSGNQDTSGRAANATNADHANNASNSDLATKAIALQTPRKINGTVFDGTADINVNAANDSNLVHTSGDETVGGNKAFTNEITFNQLINGALKTRPATFSDYADVAKNLPLYAGNWYVTDTAIKNDPISATGGLFWYQVTVTPSHGTNTGNIIIKTLDGILFVSGITGSQLQGWHKIAADDSVLHNFGDEIAAGFKKFSGNIATTSDNSMINGGGNNGDIAMVKTLGSPGFLAIGNVNQRLIVRHSNNAAISPADTFTDMFTVDVNGVVKAGTKQDLVPLDKNVVHNSGSETVGGDKTFSGNSTFNQPINGALRSRIATFTDFAEVAQDMDHYVGLWKVNDVPIANSPVSGLTYYQVEVQAGDWYKAGVINIYDRNNDVYYYATVVDARIRQWFKLSTDNTVVHNTGNETVGGDKTFTGIINATQPINGSLSTREAAFTDFNTVAASLQEYQGKWRGGYDNIANSPEEGWFIADIMAWSDDSNLGYIVLHYTDHNAVWFGLAISGSINWSRVSNDENVVHNTGDEKVNGTKTFISEINGSLNGNASSATKLATTRNINGVGFDGTSDITIDPTTRIISTETDLFKLSNGFYVNAGVNSTNKPSVSSVYFTLEVIQTSSNGFMRLVDHTGKSFWTTKDGGAWRDWHQDADDSTVVHTTGDETIGGNNTFTGNNTLNGVTTVNALVTKNIERASMIASFASGVHIEFAETATGVSVYVYGIANGLLADTWWHDLEGTLPSNITPPNVTTVIESTQVAGIAGVTLRTSSIVKIAFHVDGTMAYIISHARSDDNSNRNIDIEISASGNWLK